jgi:hypothetical protein
MMGDPRTFDEALAQFREFLWGRGVSGELIWVGPEDLLLTGSRRYYVRLARAGANETRARELFASRAGTHAGLGFRVIAFAEEGLCCCVVKRRTAGVKFSVPIEDARVDAVAVQSGWRWRWLRWKYRHCQETWEGVFDE